MKTELFLILITSLLINFAAAQSFCVDFDAPSAPSNLILTESNGNIQLSWDAATDIPDCSGISHYDIYRGFNGGNLNWIANTPNTNYLDEGNFPGGTYTYIIHAWDLVGHWEGDGVLNTITIGISPSPVSPGGGGGRSSSYWECGEWSECINETQERTCEDISRLQQVDRVETRECFPEFIPLGEGEEEETLITEESPAGFFATITGAVVGTLGTGGTIFAGMFIVAIIALVIVFGVRKRR